MDTTQFGEAFLEREFELDGKEKSVKLRIGKARMVSPLEWVCEYQIIGLGSEEVKKVHGVDSIQALLDALKIAAILLRTRAGKEHKMTWLGQDDLISINPESFKD